LIIIMQIAFRGRRQVVSGAVRQSVVG